MKTSEFRGLMSALLLVIPLLKEVDGSVTASLNGTRDAQGRIFSGVDTRKGDMTFIGGIVNASAPFFNIKTMTCTAFLIAKQWVLTAAHCYKASIPKVFVINVAPGTGSILVINIQNWIIHPDYESSGPKSRYADIALLYLNQSIGDIAPVKIANRGMDHIVDYQSPNWRGFRLTVAGFGRIDNTSERPKSLLKTYIYLTNNCTSYGNIPLEKAFCYVTGPSGEGPCPGDSGAPIMLETKKEKLALGIHSAGASACRNDLIPWGNAGINVRISWYHKWIRDTLCQTDGTVLPYKNYKC